MQRKYPILPRISFKSVPRSPCEEPPRLVRRFCADSDGKLVEDSNPVYFWSAVACVICNPLVVVDRVVRAMADGTERGMICDTPNTNSSSARIAL
ncbi:hypothetical protein BDN67DRAFT_971634 [Paxillus ammoniavirescens]|nr:hypothetical protein BDN67DRAFT_971634 [Paxillus ammoniavirescens]